MTKDQLLNSSLELNDIVLITAEASSAWNSIDASDVFEFVAIPLTLYLKHKVELHHLDVYYSDLDGEDSETQANISFYDNNLSIGKINYFLMSYTSKNELITNVADCLNISLSDLQDFQEMFFDKY